MLTTNSILTCKCIGVDTVTNYIEPPQHSPDIINKGLFCYISRSTIVWWCCVSPMCFLIHGRSTCLPAQRLPDHGRLSHGWTCSKVSQICKLTSRLWGLPPSKTWGLKLLTFAWFYETSRLKAISTSTQNASVWSLTAAAPSDSVFCALCRLQIRLLTYLLTCLLT